MSRCQPECQPDSESGFLLMSHRQDDDRFSVQTVASHVVTIVKLNDPVGMDTRKRLGNIVRQPLLVPVLSAFTNLASAVLGGRPMRRCTWSGCPFALVSLPPQVAHSVPWFEMTY